MQQPTEEGQDLSPTRVPDGREQKVRDVDTGPGCLIPMHSAGRESKKNVKSSIDRCTSCH